MNVNMASVEGTESLEGTSLGKSRSSRRCVMCDVNFTSTHDRVQHNTSLFHKFMKKRKQKHLSFIKKFRTFDKLLQSPENQEPLLGLEHIYEYIPNNGKDVPYECKLCKVYHWNVNVFTHVVGIKHRTLYLGKHHPMLGIRSDFKTESPQDYTKLQQLAQTVEQNYGRNRINIVNNFLSMRADSNAKGNPDGLSEDEQGNPECTFTNPENTRDRESRPEIRQGNISPDNYGRTDHRSSRFQPDLPIDRSLHDRYDEHGDPFMKRSYYTQKDGDGYTFPRMPQRYSPDYECERDYQPPSLRRKAFQYSDAEESIVQPRYANAEKQQRQNGGSLYEYDLQSEWSSYNARDRDRIQNRYVEFPNDPDHHYQTRTESDGYYGNRGNHAMMGGDYTTFRELKAAHVQDSSSKYDPECVTDEQEVNCDSDMEVRSMDLSDTDQETFLCNPELFEYLKTYHIGDSDDERFIMKVCTVFVEALVKHKKRVEEIQKRIAEEKLKLEEEKKAFEKQKKMNAPSRKASKSKIQAPSPSSNSKPIFPITPLNNSGLATMSAPLMPHPPCLYPTVPQSRWFHQSNTLPSEMHQGGWINAQPQRGGLPYGSNTESGTEKQ